MPVKNSQKIAAQQLKAMRAYVDFDYDLRKPLSPQSKAKIGKYYKALQDYVSEVPNGIKEFRPRSRQHLKTAQAAAGMDSRLKQFKVAFIPLPERGDAKIKFNKKGQMRIVSKHTTTSFIPLNPEKLAVDDPLPYIQKKLSSNKYPRYTVNYGEYTSPVMSADFAAEHIAKLTGKYSVPQANNYFANWLTGAWGLNFRNQDDAIAYNVAKNAASKKRAGTAAKKRRKAKYKARK